MTDMPDPVRLLDVARRLLDGPTPSLRRSWSRACAALIRLALEQELRRYWQRRAPSLVERPMRHQLLALPVLANAELSVVVAAAWHGLSRAMHHHTYELPATAAELQGWLDDTARVHERLENLSAASSSRSR